MSQSSNQKPLESLKWAKEHLPVDPRVLRAIAQVHLNEATQGDREAHLARALEALESASLAAPLDARLDYSLGWLYFGRRDEHAAEAAFVRALTLDPLNADYHYSLGRLRESQHRTAEAKALYRVALDLRPIPKARARLDSLE